MSTALRRGVLGDTASSARARFDERVRRRRRRSWRLAGALLLVLAGATAAGWVVLGSSLLGVERVTVAGMSAVGEREILVTAAVPAGTPLARVDTGAVATRVAQIPRLQAVEVHRRWPRTLAIAVTERSPLAAEPSGGGYSVLDHQGVPLGSSTERPRDVPVLRISALAPGSVRAAALAVLDSLPEDLRGDVDAVRATTADDVTLVLSGDRTVVWGGADRAPRKTLVLTALLSLDAKVYDVSAPNAPTTR